MFCSVVIPTIGRETLSLAVNSVLAQTFTEGDFEVIVVNDSGQPLPPADWQSSERVCMIPTNRHERGIARNTGAALAKGKYLCFLDDDDWLLPDALQHFWLIACQNEESVWLYGNLRVMNEVSKLLVELNAGLHGNCLAQIIGGVYVPIQASLVQSKAFFAVGGYNPSICGTEDLDLCRRIALYGDFANTTASVACLLRGQTWETSTDYIRAPEDNRRSRDEILSAPGAFTRMWASANSSYWHGRIFHVYLSTIHFNLQRRKLFTAMSRSLFSLAWFVAAGWHVLSLNFWRGAKAHHAPDMLKFMEALEREAKQATLGVAGSAV
jgi:glycosyltransferase involved in cell wall biosynthesis